jgi:hypothetical protein
MDTQITDLFNKKLREYGAEEGIFGNDMAATMKDFKPKEITEDDDKRETSKDYLKSDVSLEEIYKLAKNKKLSNNKIKQEIKKLLKNSEELDDFLRSFIKKSENKGETKEATSSGGGVGAYEAPLFGKLKEEKLKGGKSDGMSLNDIAKKHTKKGDDTEEILMDLKIQFRKGLKIESEHTDDQDIAKEIVLDHLFEDPYYYDNLKKVEATEATSTASSGAYEGPSIWAKTTSKKNWKPSRKTQIPGGKFVQVKKKCKRFPYCNQGDIKALNIFENEKLNKVIQEVSQKYDIHEEHIKDIILYELEKLNK